MIVELKGIHLFGYHGVEDEERRLGQLFLYDVKLEVGDRGISDDIADAIDYRNIALAVREVSDGRQFNLLEALTSAVADELYARFQPEWVRVRVRKPQVKPGGLTVEHSAVTVQRP